MDARIAGLAGAVFVGVLAGGVIASPIGDADGGGESRSATTASVSDTASIAASPSDSLGAFTSALAWSDEDDEEDDNDDEWGEHEHGDDDEHDEDEGEEDDD